MFTPPDPAPMLDSAAAAVAAAERSVASSLASTEAAIQRSLGVSRQILASAQHLAGALRAKAPVPQAPFPIPPQPSN